MAGTVSNDAITQIFMRHRDMVYRIALKRTRRAEAADDVFQEVFLRLVENAAKLKSEEHTKAWLLRVTENCCNSHLGSSWAKRVQFYDEDPEKGLEYFVDRQRGQPPDSFILLPEEVGDERTDALLGAIDQLPPLDQQIISLFYYEDYSVRDIAHLLEMKENAVKTRMSRARKKIRDIMKKDEKDER